MFLSTHENSVMSFKMNVKATNAKSVFPCQDVSEAWNPSKLRETSIQYNTKPAEDDPCFQIVSRCSVL